MRVLILSTERASGGAAKASSRLYQSLKDHSVDVHYETMYPPRTFLKRLTSFIDHKFMTFKTGGHSRYFSLSTLPTFWIKDTVERVRPDVINIHWVQGGYLSLSELRHIDQPILWTLHDSWLFTGGCHLHLDCKRFREECGKCPAIQKSFPHDITNKLLLRKLNELEYRRNDEFVSPSLWMSEEAKTSRVLKGRKIHLIKNPLDTSVFGRGEFSKKIPQDSKVNILVVGVHLHSDKQKGFQYLVEALELCERDDLRLIIAGPSETKKVLKNYDTVYLGQIETDEEMASIYRSCDLTVVPSEIENSSYTIQESQYCGTPVLAFDVGGNNEFEASSLKLVKPFNTTELAANLKRLIKKEPNKFIVSEVASGSSYLQVLSEMLDSHVR